MPIWRGPCGAIVIPAAIDYSATPTSQKMYFKYHKVRIGQ